MKKTKLKNRILSVILSLCLMVSMIPMTTMTAQAETVFNEEAPQLFMMENTQNWSTVNAYYFHAVDAPAQWPGTAMTKLSDSSNIYYILLDRSFKSVIFNNGVGSQTDDLAITEENRNTIWAGDGNPTGNTYSDFTLSYFDDTASIAESGDNLVISNVVVDEPKISVVVDTATYTLSSLSISDISLSYTVSGSSDEVVISGATYDSTADTVTFPKSAITHSGEVVITMQAEDPATNIALTSNGISYGEAVTPSTSWGSYTEEVTEVDGVYTITKPEQLAWVAQQVNLGNNGGGTDFSGKTIKLANTIDLGAHEWVPIGTTSNRFAGTFDGNEYEITGLYINTPEASSVGLFGYVYNGTIKNVGVSGSVTGSENVGGLVGYNRDGTVTDSYSSATVSGTSFRIGGVVGYNLGTIHNCANTGTVSGDKSTVGGVAGSSYDGVVTNSHNTGTVNGTFNIGGVVGSNEGGTVENSYNTGDVTGTQNSSGGVVGNNSDGTVENSYNTGDVTGTSGSSGGVVGSNYGGTVGNSYNTGVVSGTSYVGGVVGENNAGTVVNNYSAGGVSGTSTIGGVVGRNYVASGKTATVANSYYLSADESSMSGVGNNKAYDESTVTISNVGWFASASSTITIDTTNDTTDDSDIPETNLLTALNAGARAYNKTVTDGNYAVEWLAGATESDYPTLGSMHWGMLADAGDATWDVNEITIDTEAEFAHFANLVNGGTNFSGKTITLGADLDLLGIEWIPIGKVVGYSPYPFSGTFNGGGHIIEGLHINMPQTDYVGLFGFVDASGSVANLGVAGSVTGKNNVGGIAGYVNAGHGADKSGVVINCYSTATVIGNDSVGGIAGLSGGSVLNSYNIGTVEGSSKVGSVVGYNADNGEVENSYYLSAEDVIGVGYNPDGTVTNVGSFESAENSEIMLDSGVLNPDGLPHDTLLNALNQGAVECYLDNPSIPAKAWEVNGGYPVHSDKTLTAARPTIDVQPVNVQYEPGGTATALGVEATGDNLTYQWYTSDVDGANERPATGTGANTAIFTPPADILGITYYYCVVTNTDDTAIFTTATINSKIVYVVCADTGVTLNTNSIIVNGINDTDDHGINAVAINKLGEMATGITWSVVANDTGDEGVTIDESTGKITVSKMTDAGTYTITATSADADEFDTGENTATEILTVGRVPSSAVSVTVSGGQSTAFIPGYGEENYQTAPFVANVLDQYDNPITSGTTWSITNATGTQYPGATISSTGVVFVSDDSVESSYAAVTATNGDVTGTSRMTIELSPAKPTTIKLFVGGTELSKNESGEYIDTIVKPTDDTAVEKEYVAKVYSQYGDEMTGQDPSWSFATEEIGKVTHTNGTVSVTKDATADSTYTLTATHLLGTTISANITIKDIEITAPTVVEKLNATYGDTWGDIITLTGGSASVDGQNVPGTFSVVDKDSVPDAGNNVTYSVVFNSNDSKYVDIPVDITDNIVNISRKSIEIKADSDRITLGEYVPTLGYTIAPSLVNGDRIETEPTVSITGLTAGEEATITGELDVTAYGAIIQNVTNEDVTDNYIITYTNGTLYITVDTTALKTAITNAEDAKKDITVNDGVENDVKYGTKFVSTSVMTALETAISQAESVVNTATTVKEVTDAITALETAQNMFTDAIQTGTFKNTQTLKFSQSEVVTTVGDTFTEPTLTGDKTTLSYRSTNEDVVTVNANGEVTIVKPGTTTIVVTANESDEYYSASAQYAITVEEKVPESVDDIKDFIASFDIDFNAIAKIIFNNVELTLTKIDDNTYELSGYPSGDKTVIGWAVDGSVVVTLDAEFLKTLPAGSYSLSVTTQETSQTPVATLSVTVPQATPTSNPNPTTAPTTPPETPPTGDSFNPVLWISVAVASLVCILVFVRKKLVK